MSEINDFDEKLANRFREELGEYEATYKEADWEKLRPKLQKSPFTGIWRAPYWKPMAVAAGLALLLVSFWYFSENKNTENQTIVKDTPAQNSENNKAQQDNNAVPSEITQKTDSANNEIQNQENEALAQKTVDNQATENKPIAENIISKNQEITTQNGKSNEKTILNVQKQVNIDKITPTNVANHKGDTEKVVINEKEKAMIADAETQKQVFLVIPIATDSLILAYEVPKPQGSINLTIKPLARGKQNKFKPDFSIGLAMNPLIYNNEIENHFTIESGVQLGLALSSRVQLTTGLLLAGQKMIYSQDKDISKQYVVADVNKSSPANIGNFSAQENIITSAKEMSSNLLIVNMPINLQYYFWHGEKIRLFASVGVSNYVYLEEKYKSINNVNTSTIVANNMGVSTSAPPSTSSVRSNSSTEVFSEQSHQPFARFDLLGGINLSSGIDYQFSRRWSLQVSPFVRLPLRRVGHEQIAFNTFGLAVVVSRK